MVYQAGLIGVAFQEQDHLRDKINIIFAEQLLPKMSVLDYCDREDKENELKQLIGDVLLAEV